MSKLMLIVTFFALVPHAEAAISILRHGRNLQIQGECSRIKDNIHSICQITESDRRPHCINLFKSLSDTGSCRAEIRSILPRKIADSDGYQNLNGNCYGGSLWVTDLITYTKTNPVFEVVEDTELPILRQNCVEVPAHSLPAPGDIIYTSAHGFYVISKDLYYSVWGQLGGSAAISTFEDIRKNYYIVPYDSSPLYDNGTIRDGVYRCSQENRKLPLLHLSQFLESGKRLASLSESELKDLIESFQANALPSEVSTTFVTKYIEEFREDKKKMEDLGSAFERNMNKIPGVEKIADHLLELASDGNFGAASALLNLINAHPELTNIDVYIRSLKMDWQKFNFQLQPLPNSIFEIKKTRLDLLYSGTVPLMPITIMKAPFRPEIAY